MLDARARAEAEAKESAAKEALNLTEANLTQARSELERARRLIGSRGVSQEEYDRAEHRERAARFALKIAEFELAQARAALLRIRPRSPGEADAGWLSIRSPITGCVLEVFQENSRVVAARCWSPWTGRGRRGSGSATSSPPRWPAACGGSSCTRETWSRRARRSWP